ncbi:MAG: amino acid adenylation domain protein, partial [Verrucomicrobiales bacterium]|nr:amino acid adenylation domain protein [Verrucomicrobiales bacterium]
MPAPTSISAPGHLPLTPLQQGMYFTWLQDPAAGVDVEQMVCTLPENVDAPRLRAAWETLTAAHPVLRTTFTAESATIHDSLPISWQELPATDLPDFLETDRTTPLDLSHGPLQRLTLIRHSAENHTLVWTFHHILIDGRAITSLLREVFTAYDELTNPSAAPSAPSFEAHNLWQASLDHTPSAGFWKTHLNGVSGPTPLIVDGLGLGQGSAAAPGTPPAARSQDETDLHLPETLTKKLLAVADSAGVTLNTCIQAAFALLLGRYAGEDRVIFGATRACRHTPVPDSERIAGLLINTLPIKADLPASAPILTLFQTLRQHWLDLRPHEHSPLSFIRRAAGLSATQAPFNHLLVFENDDYTHTLRATGGPAFARRSFDLRELTSVPLTLAVYGSAALRLHCAFKPSVFSLETIQRLLGHMAELLLQLTSRPLTTPLSDFTLVTPPERQLLVHDWQPENPGIDSNTTHDAWFQETVRRHPDHIAVSAGDTAWTYAELDRRANHIAHALRHAGVENGQFVGICMDRRAPLIASLLGILKAGAAYLPIDLAYPPERLAFMLDDARAPVLLTELPLLPKIPENTATTLCIEDISFDGPASAPAPGHDADGLAYLIYTSGSTGIHKGCRITHRNVVSIMKATEPGFGFDAT